MLEAHLSWRRLVLLGAMPLLLLATYLRLQVVVANRVDIDREHAGGLPEPDRSGCESAPPGRVVVLVVDSLAEQTALDPTLMPNLAALRAQGASGRVTPCLSQLSLLCMRTIFEGTEPLLATGLQNFSGTDALGPSIVARWAAHGRRIAAVGDEAFVRTYRPALTQAQEFPPDRDRDEFGREHTLAWLADPSIDTILSLVIDTDAIAHRHGVGAPEYRAKFAEADRFIGDIVARLGPADTLVVTGDHGHDAYGYHSTGIYAPTIFVAGGPRFLPGATADIDMATLRFLLGVATCDGLDADYQGGAPLELTQLPATERASWVPIAAAITEARARGPQQGDPWIAGLPWLALLIAVGMFACAPAPWPARVGVGMGLAIIPAFTVPDPRWPWLAAAGAVVALGLGLVSIGKGPWRWLVGPVAVVVLWQAAAGASASVVLVTLQNHVNVPWMLGFWASLCAIATIVAALLRRQRGWTWPTAVGWATFILVFFGLFLGPYYYGTARNLPLALCGLWLASRWAQAPTATGRRWGLAVALPMVPVGFPAMKEWVLRYPVADSAVELLDPIAPVALAVALFVALIPDRRAWPRVVLACAALVGLGHLTQSTPTTTFAAAALLLSRTAFVASHGSPRTRKDGWTIAAADAGYCFMMFFVGLHGLRFANVDFAFALDLIPVRWGEGVAAALALPLCVVKYCAPVVLMLLASDHRPDARTLPLLLLKLTAMVATLVALDLVASPATELFSQMLAQEVALFVFLYAVVTATLATLATRRRP